MLEFMFFIDFLIDPIFVIDFLIILGRLSLTQRQSIIRKSKKNQLLKIIGEIIRKKSLHL